MWVQVAGALAEAGVGLEEITARVSKVAKAMGKCQPRDWGGGGGEVEAHPGTRSWFPAAAWEGLPGYSPGTGGQFPLGSQLGYSIFCDEKSGCLSQ